MQFNISTLVKKELDKIIYNEKYRENMLENYQELKTILGKAGSPERTAKIIVNNF